MASGNHQGACQGLQGGFQSRIGDSPTWQSEEPLPYGDGISMFTTPETLSVGRSFNPKGPGSRSANANPWQPLDYADDEDTPDQALTQGSVPNSSFGFLQRPIDASQYTNYTTDDLATLKHDLSDDGSPASSINTVGPFTPSGTSGGENCSRSLINASFAPSRLHNTGPCSNTANENSIADNAHASCSYIPGVLPSTHHNLSTASSLQGWFLGSPPDAGLGISIGSPSNAGLDISLGPRNTESMVDLDHLATASSFQLSEGNIDIAQKFVRPTATIYRHDADDPVVCERPHSSSSLRSPSTAMAPDEDDDDVDDGQNSGVTEIGLTKEEARVARQHRDMRLLELRRQGLPYKRIKKIGGFLEAESTLRGRVRNLTKDKSERVRKPEWTAHDITLLQQAIERCGDDVGVDYCTDERCKIPWRNISVWMKENGASYPFASATCSKKWEELKYE
ncbi:hypothetical protein K431DRAFT_303166 [Polychaeton citri CBS 116435]|uniref:Myb-like domain-containing protein n=1 Tax=Polychaeton citri CBS 116435 TaxID=1314669 RepID=A0A9P4Q946_9PEZI|nr:hypothetical protein K431DRAFT_303166 [Polychaeton citri CBS 116435]